MSKPKKKLLETGRYFRIAALFCTLVAVTDLFSLCASQKNFAPWFYCETKHVILMILRTVGIDCFDLLVFAMTVMLLLVYLSLLCCLDLAERNIDRRLFEIGFLYPRNHDKNGNPLRKHCKICYFSQCLLPSNNVKISVLTECWVFLSCS